MIGLTPSPLWYPPLPLKVTSLGLAGDPVLALDAKEEYSAESLFFLSSTLQHVVMLEKTLEGPLDSKEIKPVNPKEINSKYSLEGLMLKLKPQSFVHMMGTADSLEKTLKLGKITGKRRKG